MMLEIREMEELLDHEDHSQLFSASQLLALLLALVGERSNKLETFCDKISLRFKEEAEAMVEQLAKHGEDGVLKREDAVLKREDAGVVDDPAQVSVRAGQPGAQHDRRAAAAVKSGPAAAAAGTASGA